MKASVESMGGTTLDMMMPSTAAMSRPAGEKRLRSRMPHSSAVCSCTVRSRHWQSSLRPSKAPMVILLLPASRASSTYASCNNQGIGSVVPAHDQETGGVEPHGGSFEDSFRLLHLDAAAGSIAGKMRERCEDRGLILRHDAFHGGQQRQENRLAMEPAAGGEAKRSGQQCHIVGECGVVHVDADAGD